MPARKDTFNERRNDASTARQKLLDRFKARPPADDPAVIARLEAQKALGEQRRQREAAAAQRAVEKAEALAAEKAAEEAAKKAAALAAAANAAQEARRRTAAMLAAQKAERDARIAEKKKRR